MRVTVSFVFFFIHPNDTCVHQRRVTVSTGRVPPAARFVDQPVLIVFVSTLRVRRDSLATPIPVNSFVFRSLRRPVMEMRTISFTSRLWLRDPARVTRPVILPLN